MTNQSLLVIGIIGFVLLILNAVFLSIIFFMRRKMATVSQWPSTMGTVMMSTIEQRSSSEGGFTDYPVVQYSYQVGEPIKAISSRRVRRLVARAQGRWLPVIQEVRK